MNCGGIAANREVHNVMQARPHKKKLRSKQNAAWVKEGEYCKKRGEWSFY